MTEFKVGDLVLVHADSKGSEKCINHVMPAFATITRWGGEHNQTVMFEDDGLRTWWIDETMIDPVAKPEPKVESFWSDHLGDISRALDIFEAAFKEVNKTFRNSDIEFRLDGKIVMDLDGVRNPGWSIAWDDDMEALTFQVEVD